MDQKSVQNQRFEVGKVEFNPPSRLAQDLKTFITPSTPMVHAEFMAVVIRPAIHRLLKKQDTSGLTDCETDVLVELLRYE